MDDQTARDLVKATKALVLVQLQALATTDDREKPEVLLARAGFNGREIATLLNKKPDAVKETLQRAGKASG